MEAISREGNGSSNDEVVLRVSAYLRSVGLPAMRAEAEAAAAVERCASRTDLADSALDDVMSRFDAWLKRLCAASGEPSRCSPGLLAWHIRPVLSEHPDLFLREEELGESEEAVRLAVEAAAGAALPEATFTPMPAQAFGPVPRIFRSDFWRGITAPLAAIERGLTRRSKGG